MVNGLENKKKRVAEDVYTANLGKGEFRIVYRPDASLLHKTGKGQGVGSILIGAG